MNNKKLHIKSKYLILILSIVCVGAMFVTFTTKTTFSPLRTVTGYVIVPLQNGINRVGGWLTNKSIDIKNLNEVRKENEKLQARADELTLENNELRQDRFELDRLRELYGLDQKYPSYNKVAARVTAKSEGNWFCTFVIDKGSNQGIKINMNVIAGSGLVGRITKVGPNWATVKSIIDDESNVSSQILATQDLCIVSGDRKLMNENIIRMQQLIDSDSNVVVGDQVVTSNVSDIFLPGILIGYVKEISEDASRLTKSGFVSPAVDFEHLEEVLVIMNLKE